MLSEIVRTLVWNDCFYLSLMVSAAKSINISAFIFSLNLFHHSILNDVFEALSISCGIKDLWVMVDLTDGLSHQLAISAKDSFRITDHVKDWAPESNEQRGNIKELMIHSFSNSFLLTSSEYASPKPSAAAYAEVVTPKLIGCLMEKQRCRWRCRRGIKTLETCGQ